MKKILILAGLLLPFMLAAQETQTLTLGQCREMALEHNDDIRIARKTEEKATAMKRSALAQYFPKLSASGTYGYVFNNFELFPAGISIGGKPLPNISFNPSTGLPLVDPSKPFDLFGILPAEISMKNIFMIDASFEQPIFAGGRIVAGNRMGRIGMELAAENLALEQSDAILEADKSYWLYISVGEKVKLAQAYYDLLGALEKKVSDGHEVGMVNNSDLLKVQVEKGEAELALQKATNGLSLARMSLCRVLGLDYGTPIAAADSLPDIDGEFITEVNSGEIDLENRPEYNMLRKQIELKKQQTRMTRGDYLPTAGVRVGYSMIGGIEIPSIDRDLDWHGPSIVANLSIPITHWGEGSQKIRAARLDMEISEIELEKNAKLMQLQIEQARINLLDAYAAVQIAERSLGQAQDNVRMARDAYDTGMQDITGLLGAQTQWQSIYSKLIDAKTDYLVKKSEYLKAIGNLVL